VRSHVGSKRLIEVMDCSTQQNSEMSMKDWEEFFTDPHRSLDQNMVDTLVPCKDGLLIRIYRYCMQINIQIQQF